MNDLIQTRANIAAVERETGLGKDTLRVWERRYGFPQPERDANGDRLYPADQVVRLRLIKRLMDRGHRPGRLVMADAAMLQSLAAEGEVVLPGNPCAEPYGELSEGAMKAFGASEGRLDAIFERLRLHDVVGLRRALSQCLAHAGLQSFVVDIVPKLNLLVGEGWESGQIEVFEEHLYTEQMQVLLRQAIASLPPGTRRPIVMLTTVPEEQHVLGILMLEALLTLQGIRCVSLGTQTPLAEIVAAAGAHKADVVALSFSSAFPSRQVLPLVDQLRAGLPPEVALWLGGAGVDPGFEKRLEKRRAGGDEPPAAVAAWPARAITVGRALKDVLALAEAAHLALEQGQSGAA
jgi:MerR family transcriptional regulator, light-induced transcriptional regulator